MKEYFFGINELLQSGKEILQGIIELVFGIKDLLHGIIELLREINHVREEFSWWMMYYFE
jgi:hypothetical protein